MISIILYALYFICGGISGYQLRQLLSLTKHNKYDDFSTYQLKELIKASDYYVNNAPPDENKLFCSFMMEEFATEILKREHIAEIQRANEAAKWK